MTVAIGHDGVKFAVGQTRLVYSQVGADVFWKDQPLIGMGKLAPGMIAAQCLLVLLLKRVCVNVEEILKRTSSQWGFLHTLLLKKPRTPSSSGYRRLSTLEAE